MIAKLLLLLALDTELATTADHGTDPVAVETPDHKVNRIRAELRQAELERAAARVNRGIERRRRKP